MCDFVTNLIPNLAIVILLVHGESLNSGQPQIYEYVMEFLLTSSHFRDTLIYRNIHLTLKSVHPFLDLGICPRDGTKFEPEIS